MDRENRRNSILKPVVNQQSVFEYEEEQTETFTSYRQKSFKKRVSFAGRDEVKEFQIHEVLTIDKLEKALNKLQDETLLSNIDVSGWDCEKENIPQQTQKTEFLSQGDKKTASITTVEIGQSGDSVVQEMEMEVSASSLSPLHDITVVGDCVTQEESAISSRMIVNKDNLASVKDLSNETSIQEMEMSAVQEETSCASKSEKFVQPMEVSQEFRVVAIENSVPPDFSSIILEVETVKVATIGNKSIELESSSTQKKFTFVHQESVDEMKETAVTYPDFSSEELGEFVLLAKQLNWKIELFESLLVLSKVKNYLVLKFKLGREYNYQKVRHFIIEDIDIDTRKDVEEKWTRLGLAILENSLENSNLKEICSTTQDLPKLMDVVEDYTRIFLDFATEDSPKFESLVNPRSIKFVTDYSKFNLTFELSNLENLFWVRISLNLTSVFPLSAKDVIIESIWGNVNKTELTNMIFNIRPSSLYLTRIAGCIEDFLKFRSTNNEHKILNRARE